MRSRSRSAPGAGERIVSADAGAGHAAGARHRVVSPRPTVLLQLLGYSRAHLAQVIALVLIATMGAVGASAATVGGLRTPDLGAANTTLLSHSSGLSVSWGARWSGTAIVLDSITFTAATGQSFVAGEVVESAIVRSAGTVICTVSATAASTATTLTVPRATIYSSCGATGISYSTIDRVSVVATAGVAP